MNRRNREEEEKSEMNACVMKPGLPFVSKSMLARTPASEDNIKIAEFIDSHNFSFEIDTESGELVSLVTEKER